MCWYYSRSVAGKLVDTNNLARDSNRFDIFDIALSLSAQGLRLAFPYLNLGHIGRATFASSLRRMPARHNSLMM